MKNWTAIGVVILDLVLVLLGRHEQDRRFGFSIKKLFTRRQRALSPWAAFSVVSFATQTPRLIRPPLVSVGC
jgi:hypothetical protein